MRHGITGIDHPVIAVRDMSAARAAYERLGFTIPPPGSHLEWGTGNWCIMFEHDYLELRGVTDPAKYTHGLVDFLRKREGLMGVAFGTNDAEASYQSLVMAGQHPSAVRQLTRNFELPEGNLRPRFALSFLEETEVPGLNSVVLCQHLTRRLLRRPEWLVHANGARGVISVTAVVTDVDAAQRSYTKLFGIEAVTRTDFGLRINVGARQEIVLMATVAARDHCPVTRFVDEGSYPIGVKLSVADVHVTERLLTARGIGHSKSESHVLQVFPEDASGLLLEFSE